MMHQDVARIMVTEEQIAKRVEELAKELDTYYAGKTPLIVCILKGSTLFFVDLIRKMETNLTIDFMRVSSYGSGTTSSGVVALEKDLTVDIKGRDVLIVEDIIDSGNTLFKLKEVLGAREPKDLKIVTLLDKPSRRTAPINPDFTGFVIEDEFVIGYGLDYDEKYRNLPYVGVLKRSVYEK